MTWIACCRLLAVWIVSVTALAAVHAALGGPPPQPQPEFLVEMREGTTDLSQQVPSVHSCILVLADGRFHLEKKVQRLPSSVATVSVFDYSLDSVQLQTLRAILARGEIRQLPIYSQPLQPIGVPWFYGFSVRIARVTGVQSIGYWTWRGGTPAASPNSAPESVKKGWRESETALQPLERWLRSIEGLKLIPSDTQPTMCVASAGGTLQ
jgi:hypothetical protein